MGIPIASEASWFTALPDTELPAVYDKLTTARRMVTHPSGRPWLVGDWIDEDMVAGRAGQAQIVVLGTCPVKEGSLCGAASRMSDVGKLDQLARALTGSSHLLASLAGQQRLQGTVSGMRRLFYGRAEGVLVAADRADVLAWLIDAELDDQALALSLLDPGPPHPLADRPMWKGVHAVPPDHYLRVAGANRSHLVHWWKPPEAVVPLTEAAPVVRAALTTAVEARVNGGGVVSCDLSGGIDSTSICFLAARGPAELIAYTALGRDPADDDADWSMRAVLDLPHVWHEVLTREEMPLVYQGIAWADDLMDAPSPATIDRAQLLIGLRRLAARGARVHLTGLGGDEVLSGSKEGLFEIFRTKPLKALSHLRIHRAAARWSLGATLRMLTKRESYAAWLARMAKSLTEPRPPERDAAIEWDGPFRMPPWATDHAVELVRSAVLEAARDAAPVGPIATHSDLMAIWFGGRLTRAEAQIAERMGIGLAAPFQDDRVIEACLAVRRYERNTPSAYKPLAAAALRGIVPAHLLARTTKAEGSAEEEAGLRENKADLLALCENSRLEDRGLINVNALRGSLRFSYDKGSGHEAIQQTVSSEVWLRVRELASPRERNTA
ncbi:asparagine synthase-related protein [Allokutzneria albata]|uniref:asparagine synthase (glutamine-hydrolyzing) n=1 Tax=Allokutzneria albata TaxID=211114 RepID=A0A1G9QXC4_ALLAB|nr:asparagine synthase-related protein [Allokutzneria albata]SDM15634.1 asparagine synthase (glutamine-hydrolysing) [Allokutzneria albata]